LAALPAHARAQSNPASVTAAHPGASVPSRIEFIAVTGSDELLEQIGQALDGESAIRHADTVAAARALIRASQPCVVLFDAREHAEPGKVLELLQSPAALSVIVVFAPAEKTAAIAHSIKGSATFAVLPVPIETAKTAAVLEGAREEALARRSVMAPAPNVAAPAATTKPAAPMTGPAAPLPWVAPKPEVGPGELPPALADALARRGPPRPVILGAVAGLALLVTAAAWFVLRGKDIEPGRSASSEDVTPAAAPEAVISAPSPDVEAVAAPAAAPVAVAPAPLPIQQGSIYELLDKARVAFRERRYTDPEKDNAFLYYRSALAQEPDNGEALEGLARIGTVLDGRLQAAMTERRIDDAAISLAQLKLIKPNDAQVKALEGKLVESQVAAALESNNADRAAVLLRQATQSGAVPADRAVRLREEIERRQTDARAQKLAELVSIRIREGKLVEPANDSAKHHLAQLRGTYADSRRTAAAERELEKAYLQRAREAGLQKKAADVERWLDEARAMGGNSARIAAVQREARAAVPPKAVVPEAERLAKLVQDRTSDGRLLDPPQDSALFYLSALRAVDLSGAAAATAARNLSARLLEGGRASLAGGKLDDAQRHAAAARQVGLSLPEVDTLEVNIMAVRGPVSVAPVQRTADQLKRTRYVAPEYPREALAKDLRGEVRVRYTIGTDGRIKDAVVTASDPAGVFDEAALVAVRRWRFKPVEVDGQAVEATSGTAMVFQPEETNP
jgi:TonB family protein